MQEPAPGLHEVLITEDLKAALDDLDAQLLSRVRPLRSAEAPDRIAWHLSRQIELALSGLSEGERVQAGVRIARELLGRLGELAGVNPSGALVDPATVLHAILRRLPSGEPADVDEPLIPLLDTTLLTNAPGEPTLWSQLRSEIESADAIDIVMAFIRRSGIMPFLASLRRHCEDGRTLRVLTTTYTGSTEQRALDELTAAGAEVRISYDLTTT